MFAEWTRAMRQTSASHTNGADRLHADEVGLLESAALDCVGFVEGWRRGGFTGGLIRFGAC
jgi:hypothetical protein